MSAFIAFLSAISGPLVDLFEHMATGGNDEEKEREIAYSIIRAAYDAKAKRELQ